jgi:hypothetical protein
MRLEATWKADQNPATDNPARLEWSDGTPATTADFARIDSSTQSDPAIDYDSLGNERSVTFSYAISGAEYFDCSGIDGYRDVPPHVFERALHVDPDGFLATPEDGEAIMTDIRARLVEHA